MRTAGRLLLLSMLFVVAQASKESVRLIVGVCVFFGFVHFCDGTIHSVFVSLPLSLYICLCVCVLKRRSTLTFTSMLGDIFVVGWLLS